MECAGYLFPSTSLRLFEYLIVFSLVNFDILVSRFSGHEAGGRKVKETKWKNLVLMHFSALCMAKKCETPVQKL